MRCALLLLPLGLMACSDDAKAPGTDDSASPDDTGEATTPYGPDNAWYHAPDATLVPEDPGTGAWTQGELPPNLRFTDQNGDEVWLYQFYGRTVYIDWVAAWCGPCADFAAELEPFYQTHGDDAVLLTVMLEDVDFNQGDAAAAASWVEDHGSTNPVVWLSADEAGRAPEIYSFPTIDLIDPKLRLAQTSINTMFNEDDWIDQVVDRMVFAIDGDLDNPAEICGNGTDDDLDLIADCMDPACSDDPTCTTTETTGDLAPCHYDPDSTTTTVDVWRVEVRGGVAEVLGDTVSADTTFDGIIIAKTDDMSWDSARHVGDDQWECTYTPEEFGCPLGWLRPGTWDVLVNIGTGGDDEDGDCANPDLGEYRLQFKGDVTATLVQDNVQMGDL